MAVTGKHATAPVETGVAKAQDTVWRDRNRGTVRRL
jgi:hypothetical protein